MTDIQTMQVDNTAKNYSSLSNGNRLVAPSQHVYILETRSAWHTFNYYL